MKNTIKVLGLIALVAVIGFSMAGCYVPPDPDENGNENGGNNNGPAGGGNPSGTVTTDTTSEGTVLSGSANLAAKLAWLDRSAESHNTYIIEVNANNNIEPYTFNYSGAINITVILRGVGANRTIRLTKNGTLFTVKPNVIFVLDNNITLQGHSQNTGPMVYVNGGIFKMQIGSTITGNSSSFWEGISGCGGGGVYLNSGTIEMTGGNISGNTAKSNGGGVALLSGTFTMSGGTISGNTSSGEGGGVYIGGLSGGAFIMQGGTISGNNASKGGGVSNHYVLTMNGGTISGNTATEYGGGVYGAINKTDGTITGYNSDSINGNAVKDNSGVIARRGHAVYYSDTRRKETTAGPSDNFSSNSSAGWDE